MCYLYKKANKYNLTPKNLNRTMDESFRVTSILAPWNKSGANKANAFGRVINFLNLLSYLTSLLFAYPHVTIVKINTDN
jgi:hypothetical protein